MDASFTQRWIRKFRILTLSLIFSGALNIGLIAAFLAVLLQNRQTTLSFQRAVSSPQTMESSNSKLLESMAKLSFRELSACLTNKEPVEDGYTKRDLALAALASQYHFDVEKALAGSLHQRRQLALSPDRSIEIYPGLADDQFKAIIQFAYLEKWPLTSQGLFKLIQKSPKPRDESLDQAFALTPQFYALQILFQKTEAALEASDLIDLASEGSWDLLDRFAREQTQMLDLSVEKRRRLLLSYLSLRSPTAAEILLKTDFSFALKKLNDQGILDLIDLVQSEPFCLELLKSPRSDAVLEKCAVILYSKAGELPPTPFDASAVLARFGLAKAQPQNEPAPVPTTQSPWLLHTVKDGENLWKIAKLYKLKVEEITKANELEKDRLYPGMTLRIPR